MPAQLLFHGEALAPRQKRHSSIDNRKYEKAASSKPAAFAETHQTRFNHRKIVLLFFQ
jgi:hypothetical protein